MIARSGNKNFLVAHYEFVALGVGVLALVAGAVMFALSLGSDSESAVADISAQVDRMKPAEIGVKAVDMTDLQNAMRLTRGPVIVSEVSEKAESFLASERRVLCKKCKKAISGDIKAVPACPYCGEKQEEEQKIVLDADGDGMPDEWEKRYGFNPNDPSDASADADGDEFTNLEEYAAKTDPKDRNDHPDYLDSLKVVLPLKATYMPFVFTKATPIPNGWRCEFFAAKQKSESDARVLGRTITARIGEEIAESGFVLKGYEKKETRQAIKGGQGMFRTVDVSEVKLERKRDGKAIQLVISQNKKAKPAPVDVQATLAYERGAGKTFDVVAGAEISLSGTKYRVLGIESVGKGAKVQVEDSTTGKKRTLEALEP